MGVFEIPPAEWQNVIDCRRLSTVDCRRSNRRFSDFFTVDSGACCGAPRPDESPHMTTAGQPDSWTAPWILDPQNEVILRVLKAVRAGPGPAAGAHQPVAAGAAGEPPAASPTASPVRWAWAAPSTSPWPRPEVRGPPRDRKSGNVRHPDPELGGRSTSRPALSGWGSLARVPWLGFPGYATEPPDWTSVRCKGDVGAYD
eukprot:1178673-Prorocentrum_minimum.AAC.1